MLLQLIGYSMPLTLIVVAVTGAVPVNVTRLFETVMLELPFTANGELPARCYLGDAFVTCTRKVLEKRFQFDGSATQKV